MIGLKLSVIFRFASCPISAIEVLPDPKETFNDTPLRDLKDNPGAPMFCAREGGEPETDRDLDEKYLSQANHPKRCV